MTLRNGKSHHNPVIANEVDNSAYGLDIARATSGWWLFVFV
jgi:hypothetical protein